jgi:2',3'-cyclic-nucleotide 2'-phosphodiesterase (5'-nucleotidase family)
MANAVIQPAGTQPVQPTAKRQSPPSVPVLPARTVKPAGDSAQLSGVSKGVAAVQQVLTNDSDLIEILHTNDTHDQLLPRDKVTKSGNTLHVGGIAQRAAFVADEKAAHPGRTLVLDDGDTFQGTALYTAFKGEVDMKAMNLVGYDVGLLGNHDLDDGWGNFKKQMSWSTFPIISGNVTDTDGNSLLPATQIVKRGETTIGIIGLMGDSAWQAVAPKHRQDVKQSPIIPAAQQYVEQLRNKVDIIVMMTHNGYDQDKELAKAVPGIDVIVGSHSHTPLYKPVLVPNANSNGIGGTLVVQAGSNNEFIGKLQLRVQGKQITSYTGELVRNNADYPVPPALQAAVDGVIAPYAAQVDSRMNTVIGQAPAGGLEKNAFPSPLGTWIAEVMAERTQADVGLINMHGVRATMPAGPVTIGSVTGIAPFENELRRVEIPGANLLTLIESARNQKTGVTMSGVTYENNEPRLKGKPIDPTATYSVGTVDYILDRNHGGTFDRATNVKDDCVLLRDALIRAVETDARFHAGKSPDPQPQLQPQAKVPAHAH